MTKSGTERPAGRWESPHRATPSKAHSGTRQGSHLAMTFLDRCHHYSSPLSLPSLGRFFSFFMRVVLVGEEAPGPVVTPEQFGSKYKLDRGNRKDVNSILLSNWSTRWVENCEPPRGEGSSTWESTHQQSFLSPSPTCLGRLHILEYGS